MLCRRRPAPLSACAGREGENGIMMPTLWLEEAAMVVYAFDVDETLEVSRGPVNLHIVGGAMVTLHCPDKHVRFQS